MSIKRKRLNDVRESITKKFTIANNWEGYVTVGFYENKQPGEVFVVFSKQGSTMAGLLHGWAIMVSMLLQSGWNWDSISNKLKHTNFEPSDDKHSSIYDALADHITKLINIHGGVTERDCDGGDKVVVDLLGI